MFRCVSLGKEQVAAMATILANGEYKDCPKGCLYSFNKTLDYLPKTLDSEYKN